MKCYEVEKWVDFILPDKRGEINRPNQNEKGENFWLHIWLRVIHLQTLQLLVHQSYYCTDTMTIILKQIAVTTYTNSNTVAGKSFSFSHVLLLLWFWMRNFFWRLYLKFLYVITALCFDSSISAHYRHRSCSYLMWFKFFGDEKILFSSPQNKFQT